MRLGELPAATREQARDDGEVLDFIARNGGHRRDPILRRIRLGPAVEQFQRIRRGFLLEMGMIVEESKRIGERLRGPAFRCFIPERKSGFGHVV